MSIAVISYLKWEVGSHTEYSGSIYNTLKLSIFRGAYTTQFFLGSPQSTTRSKVSENDIEKSLELCKRFPMKIFSHFPYISNLAGSVQQLAWSGSKEQDTKTLAVLAGLEYELNVLSKLDGGVVIHPGNHQDRKKGLSIISKSINKINFSKILV